MPKKRAAKSDSDSDSDSGPDDREPVKKAPEKKAKSESKSSSSGSGEKHFAIDKRKQVTVREFRGTLYVDIREFYEKDGDMLPGKKGISLNVAAWNKLKDLISDIDEELSKH